MWCRLNWDIDRLQETSRDDLPKSENFPCHFKISRGLGLESRRNILDLTICNRKLPYVRKLALVFLLLDTSAIKDKHLWFIHKYFLRMLGSDWSGTLVLI